MDSKKLADKIQEARNKFGSDLPTAGYHYVNTKIPATEVVVIGAGGRTVWPDGDEGTKPVLIWVE